MENNNTERKIRKESDKVKGKNRRNTKKDKEMKNKKIDTRRRQQKKAEKTWTTEHKIKNPTTTQENAQKK
ncbi:hypothetical protein CSC81_16940 [Tenacibaculum discolor]|uniref:Uncharacterized protein n=1 Tax=Tenacibaculum discolor TaxID=361581 RepID=A0A2G1BPR3_9FLAO|nr:hypothetical protein CSC81_16940 [Tenacibaculum discolor]